MATYRVNVGNREYVVDVTDDQVSVDGKPIQASLTPLNNGGLVLLRKENRARELHVLPQGNSAYAVMVNGRHLIAQVEKGNCKTQKRAEPGQPGRDQRADARHGGGCAGQRRPAGRQRRAAGDSGIDEDADAAALAVCRAGQPGGGEQPGAGGKRRRCWCRSPETKPIQE